MQRVPMGWTHNAVREERLSLRILVSKPRGDERIGLGGICLVKYFARTEPAQDVGVVLESVFGVCCVKFSCQT